MVFSSMQVDVLVSDIISVDRIICIVFIKLAIENLKQTNAGHKGVSQCTARMKCQYDIALTKISCDIKISTVQTIVDARRTDTNLKTKPQPINTKLC